MKFVIDDKIPYLRGVLEQFGAVIYLPGEKITNTEVKNATALIVRTRTKVDRQLLENSQVRFIATATIGTDHLDSQYLKKTGISWTSCPGCNSESVAQYLTAVLIELSEKNNFNLKGKTIGIIGAGNVGKKVKAKATALGMRVLLNDPPREVKEGPAAFTDLCTLIRQSDFISLHVPLQRQGKYKTFHLVDTPFVEQMRPEAFIINTSRGEVVNNFDLKQALITNKIQGATLDVWEQEPNIDRELLKLTTIATSHIAGYSADGKENGTSMSVQAISRFFKLGIDNWRPNDLPIHKPIIEVTKNGTAGVAQAVRETYNIYTDVLPLKKDPLTFEHNRNHYQLRREFHNYSLRGKVTKQLVDLGFYLNIS